MMGNNTLSRGTPRHEAALEIFGEAWLAADAVDRGLRAVDRLLHAAREGLSPAEVRKLRELLQALLERCEEARESFEIANSLLVATVADEKGRLALLARLRAAEASVGVDRR